ncbi:MAG: hypothetical protein ACFE75_07925 [Candidatus Hodarchaeota archaeon]
MKKESMFIIGTSSLTISLILGILLPNLPLISFFEGMFAGISLAMNISFLIKYRLERNGYNKEKIRENKLQGDQFGEK